MYDLLYLNDYDEYRTAKTEVLAAFPAAMIECASDDVHPHRLAVDVDVPDEEWYAFLDRAGLHHCSLNVGLKRAIPQDGGQP